MSAPAAPDFPPGPAFPVGALVVVDRRPTAHRVAAAPLCGEPTHVVVPVFDDAADGVRGRVHASRLSPFVTVTDRGGATS